MPPDHSLGSSPVGGFFFFGAKSLASEEPALGPAARAASGLGAGVVGVPGRTAVLSSAALIDVGLGREITCSLVESASRKSPASSSAFRGFGGAAGIVNLAPQCGQRPVRPASSSLTRMDLPQSQVN